MTHSSGYHQAGNDNLPHYQYDQYAQPSPHYQMSPTDQQPYMYSQPNSASYHSPHVDSSGQWTHYQQDYMQPHMESANALVALSGSEGGSSGQHSQHGAQAQHGQQMRMPYHMPNLMPAGHMRHEVPHEHWPDHTWGPNDIRQD